MRGLKQAHGQITVGGEASHPTRVRGLKLGKVLERPAVVDMSHPTRVRGLKLDQGHGFAGQVNLVAPHAGAWIETGKREGMGEEIRRRTPRGCVD